MCANITIPLDLPEVEVVEVKTNREGVQPVSRGCSVRRAGYRIRQVFFRMFQDFPQKSRGNGSQGLPWHGEFPCRCCPEKVPVFHGIRSRAILDALVARTASAVSGAPAASPCQAEFVRGSLRRLDLADSRCVGRSRKAGEAGCTHREGELIVVVRST